MALPTQAMVYVYDAFGQLAAEYNSQAMAAACVTCYLSYDHLGTVRMVTDQNGNVVARHDFAPFGQEIPAGWAGRGSLWGSTTDVDMKFTGQVRDNETGEDYFNARYLYSQQLRFMSVDPGNAGADVTNPQSWNGYGYVLGNPLVLVDPSGRNWITDGLTSLWNLLNGSSGCSADFCGGTTQINDVDTSGISIVAGLVTSLGSSGGGGGATSPNPGPVRNLPPVIPAKNGFSTPGNCVAGFTAAGAGVGAVGGAWVGGGIGGAGGAAGGTLVAPGVGTIGGGVLGAEAGAAGGALVGGGLGAGAGYVVGSIVCSSSTGGGGGGDGLTPGARRKLGNLANRAGERVRDVIRSLGGTGANVNQAGQWADKTLGETAQAAANGDPTAETAIEIVKQAGRLGQIY